MSGPAFDWDDAKAESNRAKHGVPSAYATRVFLDIRVISARRSNAREGKVYGPFYA
jgi:uncharacterized DUF497 family protein